MEKEQLIQESKFKQPKKQTTEEIELKQTEKTEEAQ